MIDKKEYPFKYLHLDSFSGCGKVAFYFQKLKTTGDVLPAEETIFPDGSKPKPKDNYKCGTCGKEFENIFIEYVKENS